MRYFANLKNSMHCTGFIVGGLALLLSTVAQEPATQITAFFDSYDSALTTLAADPSIAKEGVSKVNQRFGALLTEHHALHTLMRINSRGKVINEVVRSGTPGRRNRSVARQSWYPQVTAELRPYYGYVKPARGPLMLFWIKPLTVTTSTGVKRSGGALLAKIEVAEALRAAAASIETPFTIKWDSDPLLTHKGGAPENAPAAPLAIEGIDDLTIRAAAPPPPPKDTATPPPAAEVAAAKAQPPAQTEPEKATGPSTRRLLAAILVGVVVFLGVLIWALVRIKHAKHERLMREIDGMDAPIHSKTVGPMPGRPHSSSSPTPRPTAARPTERRMPQSPPAPPTTHQAVPPAAPQQAPPHRADTATLPGTSPVIDPELYERLRRQLAHEISGQLRAQMMEELEAERRKINARAQVFHRTVQSHLQELLEQMTAAEGRWNELSSAMKNSAFKLKQALDGLQQGGV